MVSEIVGEMLKLSLVVTLAAVIGMAVYAHLPDERYPYVEIETDNWTTSGVDITHVGGDLLNSNEVQIIVSTGAGDYSYNLYDNTTIWKFDSSNGIWVMDKPVFQWGFTEKIHVNSTLTNITCVSVVHRRAVLAVAEVE